MEVIIVLIICITIVIIASFICNAIENIKEYENDNFWENYDKFKENLREDINKK